MAKRLRARQRYGVVDRFDDGNRITYRLTPAGEELAPIVESIGRWGVRWVPQLGEADLDPHLLMWDIHRNLDRSALPTGRTVLQFVFSDVQGPSRRWWIVATSGGVDVCDFDPGHPIHATIETDLVTLTRIWRATGNGTTPCGPGTWWSRLPSRSGGQFPAGCASPPSPRSPGRCDPPRCLPR